MSAVVGAVLGGIAGLAFIVGGLAKFSKGLDNTRSLSNVQIILWSGVVLGSYLALAIVKGGFLAELTPNLLGLMGVSAGSLIAAKGIRTIQEDEIRNKIKLNYDKALNSDRSGELKIESGNVKMKCGGLLSEEKDMSKYSIAKLQMFSWTIVSIALFIMAVAGNLLSSTADLPDVGTDLLVLMGVSHGAYIGNKIADKPDNEARVTAAKTIS